MNQEQKTRIIQDAIDLAIQVIIDNRNSLYECSVSPVSGMVEDVLCQSGLTEYDEAIGQLTNASLLLK